MTNYRVFSLFSPLGAYFVLLEWGLIGRREGGARLTEVEAEG